MAETKTDAKPTLVPPAARRASDVQLARVGQAAPGTVPARPTRREARDLSNARLAHLLSLPAGFTPAWSFLSAIPEVQPSEVLQALAASDDPEAVAFLAFYKQVSSALVRRRVESADGLDWVVPASGVDPYRLLGIVCEHVTRVRQMQTQIRIAQVAPEVTEKAIESAKILGSVGHQDRKMLLQTAGVVAVPKSSVSHVTIQNSRLTQVNTTVGVPRLEDVTRGVESALAGVQRALEGEKSDVK